MTAVMKGTDLVLEPVEHSGGGCTDLVSLVSDPGECGGGCTDLVSLVSEPGEHSGEGLY